MTEPTPGTPAPWPFNIDAPVRAVHFAIEPECPYGNPAACPQEKQVAAILSAHSQWLSYHQPPATPPTTEETP